MAELDPCDVQCCRHAPIPFYNAKTAWLSMSQPTDTSDLLTDWPIVSDGHWCGEWQAMRDDKTVAAVEFVDDGCDKTSTSAHE